MSPRRTIAVLSIPLTLVTSSCAVAGDQTTPGADLDWLWGLLVVVALSVLGGVVYKIRNPR